MKVSKMLAKITPVCNCRGYIEEGQTLYTVHGTCSDRPTWWVACPDCRNTLGQAFDYPVITSKAALLKRGYRDENNSNA
jgi:hypothetical protein